MNQLRLYYKSAVMLLRCQFQYRTSFWLQTLAQLVMMAGELLAVVLVMNRFSALGQWSGGDIMVFFGVMTTSFYMVECLFRGVTNFQPLVQSGALDGMLLRPRNVLFQVICSQVDPRRLGAIAVGAAALVMGSVQAGIIWTADKVVCLLLSLAGSCALILGLFLIEATLSVWSVKSLEFINILTYGGRSACQYPADIYPAPLRILFMVVAPFALTMHLPVAYILDKPMLGIAPQWAFVSPLAGAAFFLMMIAVFSRALRHYRSTGS